MTAEKSTKKWALRKPKNEDRREREYLTAAEIEALLKASKQQGRHGHRDSTMILMAYRHGLRVSELVDLQWAQVNWEQGSIWVIRCKNGINATHPLSGVELRALRKLGRLYPDSPFLFVSERKAPLTDHTFRKLLTRAGIAAQLPFNLHPHMLRHSTGFHLVNSGKDTRSIQHYLGHKNIQNTVRYTALSAKRFENFWND